MKPISKRVERLYMSALVRYARTNGEPIDIRLEAFDALRRRPDFDTVLSYLEAKGLISVDEYDGAPWYVTLSGPGTTYFETDRDVIRERRWTRGLAIAAIIISLCALMLELDDRGMLGGLLDGFRTNRSVLRSSEPAPPARSEAQ